MKQDVHCARVFLTRKMKPRCPLCLCVLDRKCVLYEMCMLKHAFDANNLLGLVWKIVQKKHPDIPPQYRSQTPSLS
eukprot:1341858-Amorphochlora_amoeboformis.AAC.1